MKKVGLISFALIVLTSFGLTSKVSAGLMLDTYLSGSEAPSIFGDFSMAKFDVITDMLPTKNVISPDGGTVSFQREDGSDLFLNQDTAGNTSWWDSPSDYNIYTTSEHWITMLLPENTYAFSFNVGANWSASGWLKAEAHDGSLIDQTNFNSFGNGPAPGFAVYSSSGSCSAIKSVTVDPYHFVWGVGNLSISQDSCSTAVPEPSIMALFAAGLFGLGFVRRRKRA
jgi:hypothetical protein